MLLPLILIIWGLIAIAHAFGPWFLVALVLYIYLPKGLDKIVLYVWAVIALAGLNVGDWLIAFVVLAIIDIGTD